MPVKLLYLLTMHFFDLWCVLFMLVYISGNLYITSKFHTTIMLMVFNTHKKGLIQTL